MCRIPLAGPGFSFTVSAPRLLGFRDNEVAVETEPQSAGEMAVPVGPDTDPSIRLDATVWRRALIAGGTVMPRVASFIALVGTVAIALLAHPVVEVNAANSFAGEWEAKGSSRSLTIANSWWLTCSEEDDRLLMRISDDYSVTGELSQCEDRKYIAPFKGAITHDGHVDIDGSPPEMCRACSEVQIIGELLDGSGEIKVVFTGLERPTAKLSFMFKPKRIAAAGVEGDKAPAGNAEEARPDRRSSSQNASTRTGPLHAFDGRWNGAGDFSPCGTVEIDMRINGGRLSGAWQINGGASGASGAHKISGRVESDGQIRDAKAAGPSLIRFEGRILAAPGTAEISGSTYSFASSCLGSWRLTRVEPR